MKNMNEINGNMNEGVEGGNAIEEDDDYEPVIQLIECPHLGIIEVCCGGGLDPIEWEEYNGYELWCQECEAWVENSAHIRAISEYLRYELERVSDWCKRQKVLHFHADTTHLENIVEYIQSHIHHPNNEWGNDGLHYLWG